MLRNIAIIGNTASLGYLIGRELRRRGFNIDHYCTYETACTMPDMKYTKLLGKKYHIPLERTIRKTLSRVHSYDLEIRLSHSKLVRAKNSVIIFNGSELRDGIMKPEKKCFITTKDLFQYVDGHDVRFLPRCIDTSLFTTSNNMTWKKDEKLIIGHFPTNREIKGTNLAYKAIENLQLKGYDCTIMSEFVSHKEMPHYLTDIHVLLDQFTIGSYGIITIEALSVGTPVVCHVKDENFEFPEMKNLITNCDPTAESIANAIIRATNTKINEHKVRELYSPKHTVDVLLNALNDWNFI